MVPMRELRRLSDLGCLLLNKGCGGTEGTAFKQGISEAAQGLRGKHCQTARNLSSVVPFYLGRKRFRSAEEQLWLPQFSDQRPKECADGDVFSRDGF